VSLRGKSGVCLRGGGRCVPPYITYTRLLSIVRSCELLQSGDDCVGLNYTAWRRAQLAQDRADGKTLGLGGPQSVHNHITTIIHINQSINWSIKTHLYNAMSHERIGGA